MQKKEANLPPDAGVQIYPPAKTFFESLTSILEKEDTDSVVEVGLFGKIMAPFQKMWAFFTLILTSNELLYRPLREIK